MTVDSDVVAHHLRLFGVPADAAVVLDRPRASEVDRARAALERGLAVVACAPDTAFASRLGVSIEEEVSTAPSALRYVADTPWSRLRTLHAYSAYAGGDALVADDAGRPVWLAVGGLVIVGTDLAADLVRYRQGDPERAADAPDAIWDIAGERPVHLFEHQLEPGRPFERYADHWAMTLADAVGRATGRPLEPLLPGGADGAVVVTGDDDQAELEMYERQLRLLGGTPMTYFLHPLTRHDPKTVRRLADRKGIELALHPDALDKPERYRELLHEQVEWFAGLTGGRPVSVRNHGYLSDGYWGHLPAWLDEGIAISANIPGLDGRVLSGSLLPARVAYGGVLTRHWSILTAIGDGVVFIHGDSGEQAAERVRTYGATVRSSGIAGVVVLNLHPQNLDATEAMHHAAMELLGDGFVAWNLRDCLRWFAARDGSQTPDTPAARRRLFAWRS
jgi:hypothetical protein